MMVARGAAITAAEVDGLIPDTTISVAASHDLGLAFDAAGRRGFATVISRASTLPARGSRSAMPAAGGASKVILEIVEGDSLRAADDERTFPLARLELRVPRPTADPSANLFDVDYRYDRNGILEVRAVLRHGGQEILNEELDCFGPDGTPIEQGLDHELERLLRRIAEPALGARPMSSSRRPVSAARPDPEPTKPTAPVLVIDGRRVMTAGRTAASPRPPSYGLLTSALAAVRRRFPHHQLVTVVGAEVIDAVEHHERDTLDRAIAAGEVISVPSVSPQAVLNIAAQLNAPVVSMDNLTRFRTPQPVAGGKKALHSTRPGGEGVAVSVGHRNRVSNDRPLVVTPTTSSFHSVDVVERDRPETLDLFRDFQGATCGGGHH